MADGNISRRAFTAGSATVLSSLFLPQVEGLENAFSLLPLGAQRAWADGSDGSDTTNIMVVGRTEFGIVAYDVTNPQSLSPVPNCTVKITSLFNGETLEGVSDEEGKIIFDLTDLAEDASAEIIGFNGSIEVTRDGYRDVFIPLARITAHAAFVAPTRPLDNKPYLRSASMNNWDIQYTQAEFTTSASSSAKQVAKAQIWMPRAGMTPTASLVKIEGGKETKLGDFAFESPSGNLVEGSLSGQFFLEGSEVFVGEHATLKVDFAFAEANEEWRCDLAMVTKPSPVEDNQSGSKTIFPDVKYSAQGNLIDLPESMCQPFKGVQFITWRPQFDLLFDINVLGYAVLGYGKSSVKVHDNDGSIFDDEHWKTQPRASIAEQAKAEWNDQVTTVKAHSNQGFDPEDNARPFTYVPMKKFTIKGNVQAYIKEEYDWDEHFWRCNLAALASLKYDLLWTYRFTIMGVPGFLQINPWLQAQASFNLASTNDDPFSFDFRADSDMTLAVGVTIGIFGTLGIGVPGVASVSGTAAGYLCVSMNFAPNPGHQWPRGIGGYGASIIATVQMPFCKLAVKVCGVDEPEALDTNNNKAALDASSPEWYSGNLRAEDLDQVLQKRLGKFAHANNPKDGTGEFPTFAEIKEIAAIVTNAELLASREFEVEKAANYEDSPVVVQTEGTADLVSGTSGSDDTWDGSTEIVVMTKADAQLSAYGAEQLTGASLLDHEPADTSYLPKYRYVGTMASGAPDKALGVGGISDGARGGVRPNIDRVAFGNVYSDAHMQLLVTKGWGGTYLFRIASVDLGDKQARSRLVYHKLQANNSWSQPYAVDFDPQIEGVPRNNLYDYDFSITQANANNGANYLFLLVTSGTRPGGDDIDFVRNLQAHHASLVCLYESGSSLNPLAVDPSMTASLPSTSEGYTLTNPRITGFSDPFSIAGTNDFCVMGTYARRAVDNEEGPSNQCRTMSFFARNELDKTYTKKLFRVTTSVTHLAGERALNDTLMLPVKIDDPDYQWSSGSVANCRRANLVYTGEEINGVCKFEALYRNNDSTQFNGFVESELANVYSDKMRINRVYPWGNDGEMLATCLCENDDGAQTSGLYHVSFDPRNKGEATFTQIGPRKGAVSDFAVDGGGHFLFYVENIDGKVGQTYTETGDVDPDGDIIEHRHYIKAVAQVDGLFTDPFVFCEVDHIIDGLVACSVNGSYVTFMANCITDIDNSLSDIYDVRVPLLKCLTPIALLCESAFAMSGEDCPFLVKVRNDGNLVATAATFTLYDEDGNIVDSRHLSFATDMLESSRNNNPDCGYDVDKLPDAQKASKLVADEGLGVLLPGKTETYRMAFAIPEDWHDKRTVRIGISDVEVIVPEGVKAEGMQDYYLGKDSCPSATFEVTTTSPDTSKVGAGEVHERKRGDSDWNDNEDANNDGSRSASKTTPKTGDSSLSLAALALGVAGAGIATYSARRLANERAAEQSENEA